MADIWVNILDRASHSGVQPLSTIADAGSAAAYNTGLAIGELVQLVNVNGGPGLPAVDGSLLTGIAPGGVGGGVTAFVQRGDPGTAAKAGDVWIEVP